MAVITQKSCVALFPLWSLKKTFLERGGEGLITIIIIKITMIVIKVLIIVVIFKIIPTTATIIIITVNTSLIIDNGLEVAINIIFLIAHSAKKNCFLTLCLYVLKLSIVLKKSGNLFQTLGAT